MKQEPLSVTLMVRRVSRKIVAMLSYSFQGAKQPNDYDCGPYTIHNLDRFMRARGVLVKHTLVRYFLTLQIL